MDPDRKQQEILAAIAALDRLSLVKPSTEQYRKFLQYGSSAVGPLIGSFSSITTGKYHLIRVLTLFGEQAVPDLMRALKSPEAKVRCGAAETLVGMKVPGSREVVEILLADPVAGNARAAVSLIEPDKHDWGTGVLLRALSSHGDAVVRAAAADKLRFFRSTRTGDALIEALKQEKDKNVLCAALSTLSGLKAEKAVPALLGFLTDENEKVRARAASALAFSSDPAVSPALVTAMRDDPSVVVRNAARASLARRRDPEAVSAFTRKLAGPDAHRAMAVLSASGEAAVPVLVRELESDNPVSRRNAASALISIHDAAVTGPLKSALDHPDPFVRNTAMIGLAANGVPFDNAPLVQDCESPNHQLRIDSVFTLCRIGDPETMPQITAALTDPEEKVHMAAYQGIKGGKDPRLIGPLADTIGRIGRASRIDKRIAQYLLSFGYPAFLPVAEALGRTGGGDQYTAGIIRYLLRLHPDKDSADAYIAHLDDPRWFVREAAVQALTGLGEERAAESLIALLQDRDRNVRKAAIAALGTLKDPRAQDAVRSCLDYRENPWVQADAKEALSHSPALFSGPEALLRSLSDPVFEVRAKASRLLVERKEELKYAIRSAGRNPDATVRQGAIISLADSKDTPCRAVIRKALSDTDTKVRHEAAKAAAKAPHPDYLEALIPLAKDRHEEVRFSAGIALIGTGDPRSACALARIAGDRSFRRGQQIVQAFSTNAINVRSLEDARHLIPALRSKDPNIIRPIAGLFKGAGATALLTDALDDPDPAVRRGAAYAVAGLSEGPDAGMSRQRITDLLARTDFGKSPDGAYEELLAHGPSIIPVIIQCFSSPDEVTRWKLSVVLSLFGSAAALFLEDALSDPDPGVRRGALMVLCMSGASGVHAAIERLQGDPDEVNRQVACHISNVIGGRVNVPEILESCGGVFSRTRGLYKVYIGLFPPFGMREAIRKVLEADTGSGAYATVRTNKQEGRRIAGTVDITGLWEKPGADPRLAQLLAEATDEECDALYKKFGPDDIRPLGRMLDNINALVRRRAALALSSHPDRRARNLLGKSWYHFDPAVRDIASECVRGLRQPWFYPGFVPVTPSGSPDKNVRGTEGGIEGLELIAKRGKLRERGKAILSLSKNYGYKALPVLAGALEESAKRPDDGEYRPWITEYDILPALAQYRDHGSGDRLLLHLNDDRPSFRAAALYALAALRVIEAVDPAISMLGDGSFEVRRGAVVLLGSAGEIQTVPHLIAMLDDPHPLVVRAAITSLGSFPVPEAVGGLVPFLGKRPGIHREFAVRSLKMICEKDPDLLISAAGSEDPVMRAGALSILASCRGTTCTEAPAGAPGDRNADKPNAATPSSKTVAIPGSTDELLQLGEQQEKGAAPDELLCALAGSGDPRAAAIVARHVRPFNPKGTNPARDAFENDSFGISSTSDIKSALPALKSGDDAVIRWMVRACRKAGPESLAIIRDAVRDPEIKKGAARVLLGLGYKLKDAQDREIIAALYVGDNFEEMQKRSALESLLPCTPVAPEVPGEVEIRSLVETFLDRKNPESHHAGITLGRIGMPAFIFLAQAIESAPDRGAVQERIAYVLGWFRDESSFDELTGYLKDSRRGFRAAAAYALKGIGDTRAADCIIPLLDDEDTIVRSAAVSALGGLDTVKSAKALLPLLEDPHPGIVMNACHALGKLKYPCAIPDLLQAMQNPLEIVRYEAAVALKKTGIHSREYLISMADSPDPLTRAGVIAGLQNCTDIKSRDVLTRALDDPDTGVRRAASEAFARCYDPRALEPLVRLAGDPDGEIRYNAACALAMSRHPLAVSALGRLSGDMDQRTAGIGQRSVAGFFRTAHTPEELRQVIPALGLPRFRTDAVGRTFQKAGITLLPDLVSALKSPDDSLSRGASYVLAYMGFNLKDPVISLLIALLADTDPMVRSRAVCTLGNIGIPARPLLEQALSNPDPAIAKGAQESLDLIVELLKTD